jgi:hypothetical protein
MVPATEADLLLFSLLCSRCCSYVAPGSSGRVRALQELSQGQPLEGEDLAGLKGRLAAGAAEALDQQIRWEGLRGMLASAEMAA